MVAVESRTASRRGAATPSPSTPARRSVRPHQRAWTEEEEEGRSASDRASPAAQPPSLEDYRWSRLPVAARGFRDNARRALSRQDLPHSPVGRRRRGRLGSPVLSRLFFFLADQTSMSGPDLPLPPHQLSNQDAEDLPDVDVLVQERRFRQTCIRRYRHFARRMERWREARLRGTSPSLGSPTPASSPSVDRSPTPTKSSTGAVASPMWKRLAHAAQQAATFTSRTAAAVGRTLLPGEEEVEQAPTSDSANDGASSKESSCSPSSSLMMSEGRSSSDASSVASRCRPPPSPRRARSYGLPRRLLRTCKSFFATRIATLRRGGTSTRHDDVAQTASIATRLRRQLIQAPPSSWDQPLISPEELQRLHAPTLPHWIVHRQQKLSAHRGQNVVPSATVEAVEVASHATSSLVSSAEDRTAAVVSSSSSSSIPDHDVVLRLAQSILSSSSPFHRKDPVPTLLPPLGTQPMPCEEVKQPYSASHDASTNQPHRTSILYSSSPTYGTPPRFPRTDGERRRRQSPEARQHEAHRSLLSSLTIRPRDESIRHIYHNVVSEACQHYMKEAISSVVEEMGGAALRCASELLLREGLRAIRASSSTTPSVGVLRHIRAGRPMDCNTMELDDEDRAALAKLEQTSIHNHVGSSLRSDGFQVTYGHLSSLLPRQWLNDQVINNYLQLLCEEAEDEGAISLGTHFYAKIQSELGMNHHHHHNARNYLPPLPANAAAVRWLRRRRHLLLPYDRHASRVAEQPSLTHTHVRVVLIPINLDAQHWALAVWDKVHNVWTFYDSMGASPRAQEMAAHLLLVLDHVMRECHRHLFPSTTASMTVSRIQAAVPCDNHHISSGGIGAMVRARQAAYPGTKTQMVEDGTQEDLCHGWAKAPQQHNGYDCGVFVCQVAWCVVKGTAVAITQRQMTTMRRIMALELVAARLLLRYPSELSEGGDDVLATPSSISIFPTLAAFVGSSAAQIGLSTGEVSPAAHRVLYR